MRAKMLKKELHAALSKAEDGSPNAAVVDRFLNVLDVLTWQEADAATPERTRGKILSFLDHLEAAHESLGNRIVQPAFAINVMGEAMVRSELIHEAVVDFLKVGLYFFALDQIERRWSSRAAIYTAIHADLLLSYVGRRQLKDLLRQGRERLESGRVFCLTYHYLNTLRKAYWEHCRVSEDALDVAVVSSEQAIFDEAEATGGPASQEADEAAPYDRVQMMLSIFRDTLSSRQQWIYLAKNRSGLGDSSVTPGNERIGDLLASIGESPPATSLNWSEIAERLGINEKTAKREYLRSLDILLRSSASRVFGRNWVPSGYVKRVLEQIHSIVREKDLRIRHSTGRGMSRLVEKWEVALRFVLNHQRVSA